MILNYNPFYLGKIKYILVFNNIELEFNLPKWNKSSLNFW